MGDVTFEIQLGSCFYGGLEEDAVYVGRKPNESGWISVCEEHKQQAEGDGYELMEPKTEAKESTDTDSGDQRGDESDRDDEDSNGDRQRDSESAEGDGERPRETDTHDEDRQRESESGDKDDATAGSDEQD